MLVTGVVDTVDCTDELETGVVCKVGSIVEFLCGREEVVLEVEVTVLVTIVVDEIVVN